MPRLSPKRRQQRHAEQQRRVQAALSFWAASLAQLRTVEADQSTNGATGEQITNEGGSCRPDTPEGALSHGRQTVPKSQLLDRS
jgi:hypothetical protein